MRIVFLFVDGVGMRAPAPDNPVNPEPSPRKKIEEDNLFLQLKARGKRVRFADAYLVESADELVARRLKSVTTVMTLTAPEVVSSTDDLADDAAVMQDFTRETIQDRYPAFPLGTGPRFR